MAAQGQHAAAQGQQIVLQQMPQANSLCCCPGGLRLSHAPMSHPDQPSLLDQPRLPSKAQPANKYFNSLAGGRQQAPTQAQSQKQRKNYMLLNEKSFPHDFHRRKVKIEPKGKIAPTLGTSANGWHDRASGLKQQRF